MPNSPLSRRHFLASSAAVGAAAAMTTVPALAAAQEPAKGASAAPASDAKLKIGMIGIGGQGHWHVTQVLPIKNAEIVAVCDVDAKMLVRAARMCSTF